MKATTGNVGLRKRELFDALGYRPHRGQIRVHQSKASRRIVLAASRWGKSKAASYEIVAALLMPGEKRRGWVVAPSFQLTEFIFDQVRTIFAEHFPHRVLEYTQRDRTLVVRNLSGGTSMLRAKSADDPNSLLGEALDFVVVDEAASLAAEVWQGSISQRLIDRRGWALLISTPRGKNWLYRLWRRGQSGQDPDFESWQCPTIENTYIDPALIEAERSRLPPETFAREYEAAFVGACEEACSLCQGPSASAPGSVVLQEGEELSRCKECEEYVDVNGHTVMRLGPNGPTLIIIVEIGIEETPEPDVDELALVPAPVRTVQLPVHPLPPPPPPFVPGPIGGSWLDDD